MRTKLDSNIRIIKDQIENIAYKTKEIQQQINENDINTYDDVFNIELYYNKIAEYMETLQQYIMITYDELDE